ncbi:hypothetical protein A2U01_0018923 [Trifolium medium]|uniref:Reverse transcriptase domain-containing protein n=1 Tax=Trifolium medium TaxID=97028 RepID=A0A392NDH4_9FABA|nr:hypothetical protein [Trifolium medium]
MMEVYMDDMIVKSVVEHLRESHLFAVFQRVRQHNMCLNPKKCTFGIKASKILSFYLTERGIEENLDKCEAVIKMETSTSKERIIKLNMMLTTLNRFISCSAQHALITKVPFPPGFTVPDQVP